jgi:two-component system sensor histidine kinase KdpD
LVVREASPGLRLDADDIAVATWAYQHGTVAGYDTDTLHGSRLRYIPLKSTQGVLGIMGVKPAEPEGVITHEQDRILMAFANQTALALERVNLVRGLPRIRER